MYRLNAVLPALGKMDPRWLRIGEHRGLRKRVLESFRLKDTIKAIESECYGQDAEPKDSVDQDTPRVHYINTAGNDGNRNPQILQFVGCTQDQRCRSLVFLESI